jgi:hypothetical protein
VAVLELCINYKRVGIFAYMQKTKKASLRDASIKGKKKKKDKGVLTIRKRKGDSLSQIPRKKKNCFV